MPIREAAADDWPRIWPFWHRIVAAGDTYTWARDTSEEAARALWTSPPKRVYVAGDETGTVVGSAFVTPNYGGPADRIANAGFIGRRERAVPRSASRLAHEPPTATGRGRGGAHRVGFTDTDMNRRCDGQTKNPPRDRGRPPHA
ncbi:GNAT family N-acetyltransferase [Streptomyces sp. NPDC048504]|uniref:GNAT family N-acetyltransferase n=1 Tax=Streptomyces sp. NPDC048504 TaxID=3365559 RepID=UPI00371004EC